MSLTLAPRQGSVTDYDAGKFNDKRFKFLLTRFNPSPSLKYEKGSKIHWPLSVTIKLYDIIQDPVTKKQRAIRYIPGESSIFVDEQSSDEKVPKSYQYAEFVKGEKTIEGYEDQLLEFFMKCNFNGSNKKRIPSKPILFLLLDATAGMKQMMDKDKKTHLAKEWCWKGPWEEVAAYAHSLNLNVSGDEPEQIRFHMAKLVDLDVDKFTRGMNDVGIKRKYFIQKAIELGYLVVSHNDGTVRWDGGGVITTAPAGKNPVDHLVDSTFSKDGEETFKNIMTWLKPEERGGATTINPPMAQPPVRHDPSNDIIKTNQNPVSPERIDFMITEAVSLKAIAQNGPWYSFGKFKAKGSEGLRELLESDENAVIELDALIHKTKG